MEVLNGSRMKFVCLIVDEILFGECVKIREIVNVFDFELLWVD